MRNPQFFLSGKRPIAVPLWEKSAWIHLTKGQWYEALKFLGSGWTNSGFACDLRRYNANMTPLPWNNNDTIVDRLKGSSHTKMEQCSFSIGIICDINFYFDIHWKSRVTIPTLPSQMAPAVVVTTLDVASDDRIGVLTTLSVLSVYRALISLWRHQMETFAVLLTPCAGNSPATGEFLSQRPVTRSFDVFFDRRQTVE